MSCNGCRGRLIRGFLVPNGYVKDEATGDWIGPQGQRIMAEHVEDRTTRTALRVVVDKLKEKLHGRPDRP